MKDKMNKAALCNGQKMNVLAVSFANAVAQDLSLVEAEYLSAFLQLVGEALALITAAEGFCGENNTDSAVK